MFSHYYNHINTLADLFQDNVEDSISNLWGSYHTQVEMDESKNKYSLTCELPGYDKDEISMSIKKGILSIGADNEDQGKKFKKVALPKDIDENHINAKLKNGILHIQLQKKLGSEPKKINVE